MTTVDQAEARAHATPQVAEKPPPPAEGSGNWWRHLVGLIAIVFALFPVAYVVSAAFNADRHADEREPDPARLHARQLPRRSSPARSTRPATRPEVPTRAGTRTRSSSTGPTAVLTVMLGALAAYAFSRFRFSGRRIGMLTLLLIQMFPQLLAVVAIYLIVLKTGEVFPVLGLNTKNGADRSSTSAGRWG